MEYLLCTNGLTKQYGRHKAVDSVNIHIRQGDIYGLIGAKYLVFLDLMVQEKQQY